MKRRRANYTDGGKVGNRLSEALEIVVRTDPGVVREHNEDATFANPALGFVVLADGMGGYNAGEVASRMATVLLSSEMEQALSVRAPHEILPSSGRSYGQECLFEIISSVNRAIYDAAASESRYAGMGTTLVTALFYDDRVAIAHIGDSRLYRLRGEMFEVLTRDHSLLQEQIDSGMLSGEEARFSLSRSLLTRALGVDLAVEPEINEFEVRRGDVYLLCSDGLNDMLLDDEIAQVLASPAFDLDEAAEQLIRMANDNGGRDNVSVVLVRVLSDFPAARHWWSRARAWFE